MPVLCIANVTADVGIVRLVPHAPVPVFDLLPAPLLDAAPYDFRAAGDKVADAGRVVEGRMELGEGDHRLSADVEHGLQDGGKVVPFLEGVRHRLVEHEHANDLSAHQPQAPMNDLAVLAHRKGRPRVDLIEAVAQLHPLTTDGAINGRGLLKHVFQDPSGPARLFLDESRSTRAAVLQAYDAGAKSSRMPMTISA